MALLFMCVYGGRLPAVLHSQPFRLDISNAQRYCQTSSDFRAFPAVMKTTLQHVADVDWPRLWQQQQPLSSSMLQPSEKAKRKILQQVEVRDASDVEVSLAKRHISLAGLACGPATSPATETLSQGVRLS